ncbi:thiol-disulfide oxidoreductase DCC family protein [Leptospira gomenensis]|uniref:Thiol-disulfide oxidoreductase DCC family protein n=1 Tax=Leptospira gomenensis TaxID=2484974 RepID=A0A5F1YAX6_9LEPT|nr:thiol-disulfide oxidoreductase DCC family protein [Leptospira gomenensis]TGK33728.1 thiol-disulfide oxidoreductase DCC family protein [Leptospira gomenensis]TGK41971.1 thiol-disulfide oxidoreductase DCC family protein [Leptospira gomenensis]TGK44207.1 thiol-disulfide oxidoreductase DCC family protein [Leptospira gomenensis]TGK57995.1 thiol-disulfide oxidoreductase DCC family protein [Leptospira gomenensis]
MSFTPKTSEYGIVFFDGVCNLCNGAVLFFIDHNPRGNLVFASLQSAAAERLLGKKTESGEIPSSVLFLEKGILYRKSEAVLRIANHLSFPWNSFFWMRIFPEFLRDFVYDRIARNRYRWFGKTEFCRLPTPALRSRFLDS